MSPLESQAVGCWSRRLEMRAVRGRDADGVQMAQPSLAERSRSIGAHCPVWRDGSSEG